MKYPRSNLSGRWILSGKKPVQCPDLMTWAQWFEKSQDERRIARTEIGDTLISTVFLGLDHQYGKGPPLLFETMVFYGPDDGGEWCERCSTWEQAETIHAKAVAMVKEKVKA